MAYFYERDLLGIKVYDTRFPDIIEVLDKTIEENKKNIVFGISAAAYGRLKFRPDLYGIYDKMDIMIAEGAGMPLFAKLFGIKISRKIGLVNLTNHLLSLANQKKYKVLFFGATQQINEEVHRKVAQKYPGIRLCKGINGYFAESELPEIVDRINDEAPDILFVGISYPIKERFAVKYKQALATKLIVPCGGAFDVLSGSIKKTKEISKVIPTAWLMRLVQEPKRMFKPILVTVLYSFFCMLPQLLFLHVFVRRNPSIAKFHGLSGDEWHPDNDPVK
jgi:N-acetylglucosaminyldiphosphoundecaprenol N-acetyl-beta-D-mannosaminyltransferase